MGFWDTVKKYYKKVDARVGGYLPGGVKPGSTSSGSTSSGTTSSGSTSSGSTYTSSGGSSTTTTTRRSSGGGGGSVTYRDIPAKQQDAVIVTDYTSGESVTTKVSPEGEITSQTYRKPGGSSGGGTTERQVKAGQIANRSGGLVQQTQAQKQQEAQAKQQALVYGKTQDKPFYVSDQRKSAVSYGAPIVTPKEAEKLKGSGLAVWRMESTNINDAITEAQFAGSVPYFSSPVRSRGTYEYNTRGIIAGKEAYRQYKIISSDFQANPQSYEGKPGVKTIETIEGKTYQLTPEFFNKNIKYDDIYKSSLSKAKTSFSNLPKETRRKLNIGGYATGVTSTVIGVGEFVGTVAVNLGVQTSKDGKFKTQKFYFGGTAGKIRSTPTTQTTVKFTESPKQYAKEKVRSPEFLGSASVVVPLVAQGVSSTVRNIKTLGWKAGTAETLSGFSPLRIKSGVYAQPIKSTTKFKNIQSYKYTNQQGITTRIYGGSSGNIKIGGAERSAIVKGTRVGSGYTITQTPTLNIRAGGSIVKTGLRETYNPYIFKGSGAGRVYYNVPVNNLRVKTALSGIGGTSQIKASKGLTVYSEQGGANILIDTNTGYLYRGGGITKEITPGVSKLYAGRAKAIYKTEGGVYQPSGSYKVKPQISGIEIDINKIISGSQQASYSTGGGRTTLKGVKKLDTGINAVIAQTPAQTFKGSATKVLPPQPKSKTSQTIKQPQVLIKQEITKPVIKENLATTPVNVVIPKSRTGSRSRSASRSASGILAVSKPVDAVTQKPVQDTIQVPKVIQVKKIKLTGRQIQKGGIGGINTPAVTYTVTPPPFNTPTPPPPFPIPTFAGGGRGLLMGSAKAQPSRTRYTPSFKALFFNIKGKREPKGLKTGLNFRPITPNFRFSRVIKVRRIKIL